MPQLCTIPFDAISLPLDNVRSTEWKDLEVDDLIASIPIVGLLEPLVVRWDGDEGYTLIAGFRRHRALTKLKHKGDTPVNCFEADELVDDDVVGVQLAENLMRADLRPSEVALGLAKMVERGAKQKDLAKQFNMSPAYVSTYIALTKLPPRLFALLDDDKSQVTLDDLLAVARTKNMEYVEKWLVEHQDDTQLRVWLLVNDLAAAERRAKAEAAFAKLQREQGKLGVDIVNHYDYNEWFAHDSCEVAKMDELLAEAKAEYEGDIVTSWYTSMFDAEHNRVTLLVRYPEDEIAAKTADENARTERLAVAGDNRKSEEKRQRYIHRETQKLWTAAVAPIIARPPVSSLKSAALKHIVATATPISPKRVCNAMGWEQETNDKGEKRAWTDVFYSNRQRLLAEGSEKELAGLLVAVVVEEGRSNVIVAATQEATGLPTLATLTKQVVDAIPTKED